MSNDRERFGEPGKLWSLWEVQRFYAASYGLAVSTLMRGLSFIAGVQFEGPPSPSGDAALLAKQLREVSPAIQELPLSRVLREQFKRMLKRADEGADANELMVMIREFINNLLHEMAGPWFLVIPENQREAYEQSQPLFGPRVAEVFLHAAPDIAAAGRCYALNEWTACVFHSMRALEHGLRALAADVQLDPEAMKLENWKNVIDQIEKKIREMESQPKTHEKSERIRVLSEAASDFRYFKDAWRNHVSHSRGSYAEPDAHKVMDHVRSFMDHVAGIVSAPQTEAANSPAKE